MEGKGKGKVPGTCARVSKELSFVSGARRNQPHCYGTVRRCLFLQHRTEGQCPQVSVAPTAWSLLPHHLATNNERRSSLCHRVLAWREGCRSHTHPFAPGSLSY